MKHQAFAVLSLHAKMHGQLDSLSLRRQQAIERLEAAEIMAFDNDAEFRQLEAMKKELLSIRFA